MVMFRAASAIRERTRLQSVDVGVGILFDCIGVDGPGEGRAEPVELFRVATQLPSHGCQGPRPRFLCPHTQCDRAPNTLARIVLFRPASTTVAWVGVARAVRPAVARLPPGEGQALGWRAGPQ